MAAIRCGGGGAAAFVAAKRTTAGRNGGGRGAAFALRRVWSRELSLSVSSLPALRSPWAARCSAGPSPPAVEEPRVHSKPRNQALEALDAAVADMCRPLLRNLADTLSLTTVYDLKDYQVGMLSGVIMFMLAKEFQKKYELLDVIRVPLFLMYVGTFIFDVARMKKYGKRALIAFVNLLKMKGGIREIFRIVWYPGYVSPYDDGF